MKKLAYLAASVSLAGTLAALVLANPTVEVAPEFTLPTADGKNVSLADFKGKYVVLEWWNHECPFVRTHYTGNMQSLQKQMKAEGVVWLTICSSAVGTQGHVDSTNAADVMKTNNGEPAHVLLDPQGTVGKLYKARATPQMVLINPKGEMVYNGAIDSIASGKKDDIAKAENYLLRAYGEVKSGKPVSMPTTRAYGCSVKYAK